MSRHLRARRDDNHAQQANSNEPVNAGYTDGRYSFALLINMSTVTVFIIRMCVSKASNGKRQPEKEPPGVEKIVFSIKTYEKKTLVPYCPCAQALPNHVIKIPYMTNKSNCL